MRIVKQTEGSASSSDGTLAPETAKHNPKSKSKMPLEAPISFTAQVEIGQAFQEPNDSLFSHDISGWDLDAMMQAHELDPLSYVGGLGTPEMTI